MTANLITEVSTSTYNLAANSSSYVLSRPTNLRINLPPVGTQNIPISIINFGENNLQIFDSLNNLVDIITSFSIISLIPSNSDWLTSSYTTTIGGSSNTFSPIIPLLGGPAPADNNQFFGVTASSNGPSSQPYYPFSVGGLQYWNPNTSGNETLMIEAPTTFVAKAILLQLRGASGSNHYNRLKLEASRNGTAWINLLDIPNNASKSTNVYYSKFKNEIAYNFYRINILNSVGTLANLGIFNMQLYGYYN